MMVKEAYRLTPSWPLVSAASMTALLVLTGGCTPGVSNDRTDDVTLSIMSFNIFHNSGNDEKRIPPWPVRKELVTDTIERQQPDIVSLQEAYMSQVMVLTSRMPQYTFVGRGRNEDGSGESVSILFNRQAFTLLESGHFWFSDSPSVEGSEGDDDWGDMTMPRMTTWIRLRKNNARVSFYVFNTHLAADSTARDGSTSRMRSAMLLADRIAARAHPEDVFFVTGDFNATYNELPIEYLTNRASAHIDFATYTGAVPVTPVPFLDIWRAKNDGRGMTRCSNVPGVMDGSRIDYIFTWKRKAQRFCNESTNLCTPLRILNATIIPPIFGCASDHRPVFAKMMFPAN